MSNISSAIMVKGIVCSSLAIHLFAIHCQYAGATLAETWAGVLKIGKVGDKVLFYPGIQFVFANQRVWAIILVKK